MLHGCSNVDLVAAVVVASTPGPPVSIIRKITSDTALAVDVFLASFTRHFLAIASDKHGASSLSGNKLNEIVTAFPLSSISTLS
jgi:hypothetical protein